MYCNKNMDSRRKKMIYFITALYNEAKPLIRAYSLKPVKEIRAFRVFADEAERYVLVVSGVGKAHAAAAVGCVSTYFGVSDDDFLIHIGTAAVLTDSEDVSGRLFLCHRMIDHASRRTYYPDMLLNTGLREASIVTVDRVLVPEDKDTLQSGDDGDGAAPVLADMESSAIWEAGMCFFAPHRILIAKAVTDAGDGRSVTARDVDRLITDCLPEIEKLTETTLAFADVIGGRKIAGDDNNELIAKLARDLHCSETMKIRLMQLCRYASLEKIDLAAAVEDDYKTGDLPCRDRREGKKILEKMRNRLL